jgi:hypothetical protein
MIQRYDSVSFNADPYLTYYLNADLDLNSGWGFALSLQAEFLHIFLF